MLSIAVVHTRLPVLCPRLSNLVRINKISESSARDRPRDNNTTTTNNNIYIRLPRTIVVIGYRLALRSALAAGDQTEADTFYRQRFQRLCRRGLLCACANYTACCELQMSFLLPLLSPLCLTNLLLVCRPFLATLLCVTDFRTCLCGQTPLFFVWERQSGPG